MKWIMNIKKDDKIKTNLSPFPLTVGKVSKTMIFIHHSLKFNRKTGIGVGCENKGKRIESMWNSTLQKEANKITKRMENKKMQKQEKINLWNELGNVADSKEKDLWAMHKRLEQPFDYTGKALELFIEAGELAKDIIKIRETQLLVK